MNVSIRLFLFISLITLTYTYAVGAGIKGQKAPSFSVTEWTNLPEGKKSLDVSDYEGKVLYLYCFQSWCPGCHKSGFPTLKQMMKEFSGDKDVAFVTIQTTFEGFSSNTFARAQDIGKKYQLNIPIGQSGSSEVESKLMEEYRTRGTPWTIIIDKQGVVQYNDFHIKPEEATKLIRKLK